ncbi:DNA polymerase III subunit epsilon [Isoptericola sp. NEAU-Y5]|uniref:DNA polymerase III subunit epsilon n=1 Tax=Isoptericola luteus TaxID=2879484 RepID=A0ABS7ZC29_9MICO|nr:exonuclease domain-containing protein [Isoptericola sp. NEAU-Y5]MCA5892608.1 DNA polymerase III subunit epsilon [Isoptericola sp. NEAU-Y5]
MNDHGDTGWAHGPLVGFDTETTGVDVTRDRIVTAAVVVRAPGRHTDVRTWLLDPGVEIPTEATAIHGITTAHARGRGRPPAGALDEIARSLVSHLRAGTPLVAYNATFDLSLLDVELARHGLATLAERLGRPVAPVLDPLVLDRWLDGGREGKRRLGDLCALYGIAGDLALHTADVDVLATLDVLDAQLVRHPHLRGVALDALHAAQAGAYRRWAQRVNAERAAEAVPRPPAPVAWPADRVAAVAR